MKSHVYFVILTYFSNNKTIERLVTLLSPWPVVVVDNTPGGSHLQFSRAILIETKKNIGYTGGMNKGIRTCMNRGAQWIIVVNDDMVLTKKGVASFIQALAHLPPGVAGIEGGILDKKRWTTILSSAIIHPEYISGSFMAIHRNVLDRVGLLYEPYFIYYEDVELCVRAKRVGFPIYFIPSIGIRHTEVGHERRHHSCYLSRNHLLFVERNAPAAVKLREYLRLPKTLWEHWHNGDVEGLHGIKDYFLRRFGKIGGS